MAATSRGTAAGRRTSSRIQKIRKERGSEICYNETLMRKVQSNGCRKEGKLNHKSKDRCGSEKSVEHEGLDTAKKMLGVGEGVSNPKKVEGGELKNLGLQVEIVNEGKSTANVEKSASLKVKETLRTFNRYYLHFIQEEEQRCNPQAKRGKCSNQENGQPQKATSKRPDLKALSKMRINNEILYPTKQIGAVPGVEVGHQFFSRAEMVVVGFHGHWLKGIDFMTKSYCKGDYSGYTFPIAIAVVLSGQYEDDSDNSEYVDYTGEGGNNLLGDKHQIGDQVMKFGNLALQNSMNQSLPVRFIRGHDSKSSYVGKVYTYDGLYKVVHHWSEKGKSGFNVLKFRLKRLKGQPELTTNQVRFVRGQVPGSVSEVNGLVCEDISQGQEDIPIPATNSVDEEPFPPAGFVYRKTLQVAANVKIPGPIFGCNCKGMCVDPETCACAKLNGDEFPYVQRNGGRLIEPKAVVFECGPKCGCGPGCVNRTSQRGIRYRFEVFRTPKKGWGVRSWDSIPAGALVCEYIGILKRSEEAESVAECNYIFDIDCLQTMKGLDGRERRLRDVSLPTSSVDILDDKIAESAPEFCIDAGSTGNFARFINHSCEPNLFVQCILSSHHNISLARVVLFAADSIPPLQELTYDYGYPLDSVTGPDGKIKKMSCFCGAPGCRKRLF